MTRKHGIVLEDILKDEKRTIEEKLNTLENVVDYLAFIHANVPATGEFNIERGKADVGERLKNLEKLEVGYKNEDTLAILENYNLITESIRNSVYVFNKDAHPRNWTIAPNGNIIALDLEGGTIPQAYDLVKLIEHGDYLNEEQKDVLMRTYLKSYTGYKQDSQSVSTFDNFKFQYLNLTLHKALTFVGSWSKEKEDADWNRNILIALKNAQKAFEIIKRNYSNSYSYYEKLQEGVTKIEELLRLDYERRFV